MAAGVDGDSRILGPATAERPERLDKSMGEPRPPRPFDQALQEAPPLRPGSPTPKLPIIPGFSTFLSVCGKNTPTSSLLVTGTPCVTVFFPKP